MKMHQNLHVAKLNNYGQFQKCSPMMQPSHVLKIMFLNVSNELLIQSLVHIEADSGMYLDMGIFHRTLKILRGLLMFLLPLGSLFL